MEPVISVENVTRYYRKFDSSRSRTLHEALVRGFKNLRPLEQITALQDINFSVSPGTTLGLVGRNGSGKSTLLELLGGIGLPSSGNIKVAGRVHGLLELGAGFHPDLTGRENVFVAGVVSGLTRAEVEKVFDDIVTFAELEEFIESPIRTYSSGMLMRLGFSVAAHVSLDVLLVDEILAVGDEAFSEKCLDRIKEFKEAGCTIVICSHDMNLIESLCDEALLLEDGNLLKHGPPNEVVEYYRNRMRQETLERTPTGHQSDSGRLVLNENRFGSQEIEIIGVSFQDKHKNSVTHINSGDSLIVTIDYRSNSLIESPIFEVSIKTKSGNICYQSITAPSDSIGIEFLGSGKVTLEIERLDLNRGEYLVDVGIYQKDWDYSYDYHWQVYSFYCEAPVGSNGVLYLPHKWDFNQ